MTKPRLKYYRVGSPEGVIIEGGATDALQVKDDQITALPPISAPNIDALRADADTLRSDVNAIRNSQVSGVIGFATRAELMADLEHAEGTVAYVTEDAAAANNGTYRKVGGAGTGTWEQGSRGWSANDVAGILGGAMVSRQTLVQWTESEAYEVVTATRNTAGLLTSATVRWPDSSGGTLTVTATDPIWGAVNAFTLSHAESGKVVSQNPVVRDPVSGAVTAKPALSVA